MKNIVNYLDEYLDEDTIYETVIKSKSNNINKDRMKAFKKGSCKDEINAHEKPISYNHIFRDKSKYNRKEKHKNKY